MSVSKWAYDPERCDGQSCCGDCDLCEKLWDGVDEEDLFPQSPHEVPTKFPRMINEMVGRTVTHLTDLLERNEMLRGRRQDG